jgi:hypothetical protein
MGRDLLSLPPVSADERIAYGTEPNQFFDFLQSQEEGKEFRGAIVMIHGGFWRVQYDLTHASHACAALARAGLAVASLEYRRVGDPGGGWPSTFEDVIDGFTVPARTSTSPPVWSCWDTPPAVISLCASLARNTQCVGWSPWRRYLASIWLINST